MFLHSLGVQDTGLAVDCKYSPLDSHHEIAFMSMDLVRA